MAKLAQGKARIRLVVNKPDGTTETLEKELVFSDTVGGVVTVEFPGYVSLRCETTDYYYSELTGEDSIGDFKDEDYRIRINGSYPADMKWRAKVSGTPTGLIEWKYYSNWPFAASGGVINKSDSFDFLGDSFVQDYWWTRYNDGYEPDGLDGNIEIIYNQDHVITYTLTYNEWTYKPVNVPAESKLLRSQNNNLLMRDGDA